MEEVVAFSPSTFRSHRGNVDERAVSTLFEHLSAINDPRVERTRWHKLIDILVIAVCATICGAESFPDMEEFGKDKEE